MFTRVLRPQSAIPQLKMDHPSMLDYCLGLEQDNDGLYVCGFGWDGIDMKI